MLRFLAENLRWLAAGYFLTFASAFGQTWFISLSAGFIKQEYGLSDGSWGSLYTVATLCAAGLMFWRGSAADSMPLPRLAAITTAVFSAAAVSMAMSRSVWLLGVTLFLLRFCGQGMFGHIAMTAIGRWFVARRGQAIAIANLGYPSSEITISAATVLSMTAFGWRTTWLLAAAALAVPILPLLAGLLAKPRRPQAHDVAGLRTGLGGRHWRRQECLRHWLLPALLPSLLTPGFIGTVVFFHQAHVAESKGWKLVEMAPGFTALALCGTVASFVAGWAADRFGMSRLLPLLLLPMGVGISLVGPATHVTSWYVALGLIGITMGIASTLWGVLLPAAYGTENLGAIRSLATTIMVIATAIGPGLTGILIDQGVDFPEQCLTLGLWCFAASAAAVAIQVRLARELAADVPTKE